MIVCPKCNKQLEDGAKFCDGCGNRIEQAATVFCPNCGNATSSEYEYCQRCGFSISTKPSAPKVKKAFPVKAIGIAAAAVVAVLLLILVVPKLFGGSKGDNYAFYIKDDEVFYRNLNKKEAQQATDKFLDDMDASNSALASDAYDIGMMFSLSEDGKILFHPDKLSDEDEGYTLYYSYMSKLDKDATKIDSDIDYYYANDKGTVVTYLKDNDGSGGVLYQYSVKSGDKNKIASDIVDFYALSDGKTVIFKNDDGDLYLKSGSKDKEKIDSDVESIESYGEKAVYYMKEDVLYACEYGKDKQKIASGVSNVINIYESGEIYYVETETDKISAMDMVNDDVEDDEDYDDIREALENMEYEKQTSTLFYYDGKNVETVCDTYTGWANYAYDEAVLICYTAAAEIKLSDMEDAWDFYDLLYEAERETAVVVGKTLVPFDYEDARYFDISDDGKLVYFMTDVDDETYEGDLCSFTVSDKGKLGDVKTCDSDVYAQSTRFLSDDRYMYLKDYDDDDAKGELFVNGKSVASDVYEYSISYSKDSEKLYFYTDRDTEKARGTLNAYNGKKVQKVADDVYTYRLSSHGDVLFLSDYSLKNYKGDLYRWTKGDPKKIDEDVVAILPVY